VVYRHSDPKRCPHRGSAGGVAGEQAPCTVTVSRRRQPVPSDTQPAAQEAGAAWAGFHAFRHYCASALIADGRNIVQVSRWLGHHSPSFTLDVYAHLMDDGVGAALELRTKRTPDNARSSQPRPAESDGAGDLLEHH
jgi:hypothetical protein